MEINEGRPSAVLLPLVREHGKIEIVFEKRSESMKVQPGAICLPGGRIKVKDGRPIETPMEAAIRETAEELLISPEQIKVERAIATTFAPDGTTVYPFAGELLDYRDTFDPAETERIFRVPLRFFEENPPERHYVDFVTVPRADFPFDRIRGGEKHPWTKKAYAMLFYQYEDLTIWGMTARVIDSFIRGFTNDTEDI